VLVNRHLLLSELTQHLKHYGFLYPPQHVSAVCISQHQVEWQNTWTTSATYSTNATEISSITLYSVQQTHYNIFRYSILQHLVNHVNVIFDIWKQQSAFVGLNIVWMDYRQCAVWTTHKKRGYDALPYNKTFRVYLVPQILTPYSDVYHNDVQLNCCSTRI
jgi:hypothetical protein